MAGCNSMGCGAHTPVSGARWEGPCVSASPEVARALEQHVSAPSITSKPFGGQPSCGVVHLLRSSQWGGGLVVVSCPVATSRPRLTGEGSCCQVLQGSSDGDWGSVGGHICVYLYGGGRGDR